VFTCWKSDPKKFWHAISAKKTKQTTITEVNRPEGRRLVPIAGPKKNREAWVECWGRQYQTNFTANEADERVNDRPQWMSTPPPQMSDESAQASDGYNNGRLNKAIEHLCKVKSLLEEDEQPQSQHTAACREITNHSSVTTKGGMAQERAEKACYGSSPGDDGISIDFTANMGTNKKSYY